MDTCAVENWIRGSNHRWQGAMRSRRESRKSTYIAREQTPCHVIVNTETEKPEGWIRIKEAPHHATLDSGTTYIVKPGLIHNQSSTWLLRQDTLSRITPESQWYRTDRGPGYSVRIYCQESDRKASDKEPTVDLDTASGYTVRNQTGKKLPSLYQTGKNIKIPCLILCMFFQM